MDVGLLLRIAVYILGGILPFIYNYYFVKKKLKIISENERKSLESNVENFINAHSSNISSTETHRRTGEISKSRLTLEPTTIITTSSLETKDIINNADENNSFNPLYIVFVIDKTIAHNPSALNSVIMSMPEIVKNVDLKKKD